MLWVKYMSTFVESSNPDLFVPVYRRCYYLIKTFESEIVDEGYKVYFHEEEVKYRR